jgi:hypothetical protein
VSTFEKKPADTVERHPVYDYPAFEAEPSGEGAAWLVFAAVMLGLGGIFGLMAGIVALADSSFYVAGAHFVFSSLHTWGWIMTIMGTVAVLAALAVPSRAQWARWSGIFVAGFQAVVQLLAIQGYPMWSLAIFAIDLLVIYALAAHGGKPVRR